MARALAVVEGLYLGRAAERWPGRPPSAIGKAPAPAPLTVTARGVEGDEQADLSVHGGPDKALHHYPADHYPLWRAELPDRADRLQAGGFGENLSTSGVTESDLCVGDVISAGTAVLQVSHGRQPCWKLSAHLDQEDLAYRVRKTGRTGWYYRVLEPGEIRLGAPLNLEARPQPDWPLARVIAALFEPRLEKEIAAALADLPELADVWRADFAEKARRSVQN